MTAARKKPTDGKIQMLCALMLYVAALIGYLLTGRNEFNTVLSLKVVIPLAAAIALSLAMVIRGVKMVKYLLYLCGLYAWAEYIVTQVNYIANVFVAIDGTTFSVGFLLTLAAGLLAWIMALSSAICQKTEITGKEA